MPSNHRPGRGGGTCVHGPRLFGALLHAAEYLTAAAWWRLTCHPIGGSLAFRKSTPGTWRACARSSRRGRHKERWPPPPLQLLPQQRHRLQTCSHLPGSSPLGRPGDRQGQEVIPQAGRHQSSDPDSPGDSPRAASAACMQGGGGSHCGACRLCVGIIIITIIYLFFVSAGFRQPSILFRD